MDVESHQANTLRSRPTSVAAVCASGALVVVLWLAARFWIAPGLIRSAYNQESIPFFNAFIGGQARLPVDYYLNAWTRVAGPLTIALVALVVVVAVLTPWHRRIYQAMKSLHSRLLQAQPLVGLSKALLLGGLLGWIGGVFEALADWNDAGTDPSGPTLELFWMAPTAAAFIGASIAGLVCSLGGGRVSLRALLTILGVFTLYTAINAAGMGIHPAAIVILGLGVGVEGSRHLVRSRRFVSGAGPGLALVLALTAVGAAGMKAVESLGERRALAAAANEVRSGPNILLLILDTVRAQNLSLYGYHRNTSPNIDALAEESVVFERALSTASWTLPSHASMLTGLEYDGHGADWHSPMDPTVPSIAEVLKEAGHATGAFVANSAFGRRRSGMDRGFDTYRDNPVDLDEWVTSHWGTRFVGGFVDQARGRFRGYDRKSAEDVNKELLGWLDRLSGRPFFAMVNYYDAHDPYESPPPFNTMFRPKAPRAFLANWGAETEYVAGEISEMTDAYDSSIAYLDHELGRLFDALRTRGVLDNTVLIVTSDHGEHFGERGLALHGNSLYLPSLHVPLLVRAPGSTPAGTRVTETVTIRDVPATLLDLANIPSRLPGTSMAWLWHHDGGGDEGSDRGVADSNRNGRALAGISSNEFVLPHNPVAQGAMKSVTSGRLHYILNGDGVEELYDWDRVDETENLIRRPEYAADLERLRSLANDEAGESGAPGDGN